MNRDLINDFINWQWILRQKNFRKFSGKPSEGTIASIIDNKNNYEDINLKSIIM